MTTTIFRSGEGIIVTTHDQLAHYLQLTQNALPIESKLLEGQVPPAHRTSKR